MAKTNLKRMLWMMNELVAAGERGITKEELIRRWSNSKYNESGRDEIAERTFYRTIKDLSELFDVEIAKRDVGRITYYSVEQTDYSVFLGMLCGLVSDNSKRNLSLKDLLQQVMNDVEISEEEKKMLDAISYKLGKEAFDCGNWLINEARRGGIKGADHAQWAEYNLYHICIWLDAEYEKLQSWVGVFINRHAKGGGIEVRFYIVCESQDESLHALLQEKLDLLPGEKREGDYWWFAPSDEAFQKMDFVSVPDRHAILARIEQMLARLNAIA